MGLFEKAKRAALTREQRQTGGGVDLATTQTPFEVAWANTFRAAQNTLTAEKAIGFPPVSECVDMLAGDLASIPLHVYVRDGSDRTRAEPDHYAEKIIGLWGDPGSDETTFDLWYQFFFDALIRRCGLLWIERDGARPVGLYRLDPDAWRPVKVKRRRYWVNYANDPIILPDIDVIHHTGIRIDGLNPNDPVRLYGDTLQTGVSLQKFTSKFFDNGAHVGGILTIPPGASGPAIANVEKGVRDKEKQDNWFKTLILRDGFNFQKTTVDPADAQASELDETSARHVCRIYKIPPSRIGLRDSVAYNSLESEEKRYFRSAMGPHLIRVRSQCHKKLLLPSDQSSQFIDYLVDALLWTDSKTRATIGTQGIQAGWLHPDEVRRWHNLPSRDDLTPRSRTPKSDK